MKATIYIEEVEGDTIKMRGEFDPPLSEDTPMSPALRAFIVCAKAVEAMATEPVRYVPLEEPDAGGN